MEKSSYYLEIFGDVEEITSTVPTTLATLVTDDPLFSMLPGSGAADAACERLLDDSFAASVTGMSVEEFRKTAQFVPSAPLTTADHSAQIITKEDLCPDLDTTLKNAAEVADYSLRRARWHSVISTMVQEARSQPVVSAIRDSDGWRRLVDSCVDYAAGCVRDCA